MRNRNAGEWQEHMKNLAKSNKSAFPSEYLAHYCGKAKRGASYPVHTHAYWQMELLFSGRTEIVSPEGGRIFKGGEFVIIPAGLPHGFRYLENVEMATVMFDIGWLPKEPGRRVVIPESRLVPEISALFAAIFKSSNMRDDGRRVFESLVRATLELSGMESMESEMATRDCVMTARDFIEARIERPLTVAEVAQEAGLSAPYLSSLFRKRAGVSLKRYIAGKRMDFIKRLLIYTALNVTDVSKKAGFPDIYAFSRFVKRESGKSPLELRRASLKS